MSIVGTRPVRRVGAARAQALDEWRTVAALVRDQWGAYVASERASRAHAFAAYLAALDLESAAADDLAAASSQPAA